MRLFEAIIEANHRALAGDAEAGVHPADHAGELPMVALTCIDARLNRLLPHVLGVSEDHFIWSRNAGNIITGPLSSTMRSLALACALKGGQSVAIIGHTDCQVRKFTTQQLIERFAALGVSREHLPAGITEYFGTFASEQANVIKAVDFVRHSPLISPRIAVHGLLLNTETGEVDWVVDGYRVLEALGNQAPGPVGAPGPIKSLGALDAGPMKFPEVTIGQPLGGIGDWASHAPPPTGIPLPPPPQAPPSRPPQAPPKIPLPRAIPPTVRFQKGTRPIRPRWP